MVWFLAVPHEEGVKVSWRSRWVMPVEATTGSGREEEEEQEGEEGEEEEEEQEQEG